MITIHEELENYSLSKLISKCYYYLSTTIKRREKKSTTATTDVLSNITKPQQIQQPSKNIDSIGTKKKEIDGEMNITLVQESKVKKTVYGLVGIEDTPAHLARQYILFGYRVDFSYWLAFKSIFYIGHNDFANIHSHLIPAICFMVTLYGILVNGDYGFEAGDKLVFTIFIGAAITTFVFSFLYHTFGCHSQCTYSKLLICDYLGIILLIGSSFFPPLYYAFKSKSFELMIFYMGSITFLCTSLAVMVLLPSLADKNTLRNILFCLTALFGIIPACHTLWFYTFDQVAPYFLKLLSLFAAYGMGLVFYIFKIPESFLPGNPLITSHSIWHLFVSYGTYISFMTSLSLFELFKPATTDILTAIVETIST